MLQGIYSFADQCWRATKKMYRWMVPPTNLPDFAQSLPAFISKKDIVLDSGGREASLIPLKAFFYIRKWQIANPHHDPMLFTPESHPHLGLKWPVFLGENGRLISVVKDEKRKLGDGGFGTVYWGIDEDTKKQVAVKYQNKLNADDKKEVRAEIRAMSDLNRLVSSIELNDDTIIAVDEFNPGQTCDKVIEPLRTNKDLNTLLLKLEIGFKALKAIDAQFHQKGYLHRDIKTGNVMWDAKTKTAKVIDFGTVVKVAAAKGKKLESEHGNTNIYLSPEVVFGHYSMATDMFACGVFLIDLLSEFDIFDNEEEWLALREKLNKHNNAQTRKEFVAYLNRAAKDLLMDKPRSELTPILHTIKSMISHNPKKRPNSLQPVITALENQYHGLLAKADDQCSFRPKI